MNWKRARSDEQKEVRVRQILEAAGELFGSVPYAEISMATIAKKLDFTRGNLYKYFATKEEILLKLLERDMDAWVADLNAVFGGGAPMTGREFGIRWAETLLTHKRLIELLSILYTVIEKNVSVERLADFKSEFFREMPLVFRLIHQRFPKLSVDDVNRFLTMQMAFAMGLYPMSVETELQRKAIELSGVQYKMPEFIETFAVGVEMLIAGFEREG